MNLVAKECVAHRDDEDGVLILSKFAGAIHELPEAYAINPFDTFGTSQALRAALDMPRAEQTERMRRMRETVRHRNVFRWAGQLLEDAVACRERNRLAALEDAGPNRAGPETGHADPSST